MGGELRVHGADWSRRRAADDHKWGALLRRGPLRPIRRSAAPEWPDQAPLGARAVYNEASALASVGLTKQVTV